MSLLLLSGPTVRAKYALKDRVSVKNGQWYDATGPVHLFFHSDFQLINLMATDLVEARRSLNAIARVGSGVRFFTRIAADFDVLGTNPYFSDLFFGRNNEIDTAMCRRYLPSLLDELAERDLKACTTMGSLSKTDEIEMAFHDEVADIIVRSGHQETIAIAEHRNEPNMTSQYGWEDRAKAWALAKRTMQAFKVKVGCLITGGSWGDNDQIAPASDGMDCYDVHEERSMPEAVHHVHTHFNDLRFHRDMNKQVWGGERPGPNAPYPENTSARPHASKGGDMYVGNDDPELAWGVIGQAHFTGQGTAWLNGPGVRHAVPIDSTIYGFAELPSLIWTHIPRDVGLWRGPNPTWRTPGTFDSSDRRFLYAGLREWNQIGNPPFQVGAWKAIGPYGVTHQGTGPIAIEGDWTFRLIVGTRA